MILILYRIGSGHFSPEELLYSLFKALCQIKKFDPDITFTYFSIYYFAFLSLEKPVIIS